MRTVLCTILAILPLLLSGQSISFKKKVLMEFDKNATRFEPKGTKIGNSEAFLGDLNADGKADGIVFFVLSPVGGGNALMGMGIVVYKNVNGYPKEITVFRPDFFFSVEEISDYKIHIIKSEYADGDYPSRPSIHTHLHYIINSQNKLQESRTY